MWDETKIWDDIVGLVRQTFLDENVQITTTTVAADVDGWDSISHTILILELEQHFGIAFPDDRIHTLADVGDLYALIRHMLGLKI